MKKLLPFLLAGTMFLTACSSDNNTADSSQSTSTPSSSANSSTDNPVNTADTSKEELSSTITIVDHDGVEVTLDRDLERVVVVTLNPMPSLLALFLGGGETIVGMNSTSLNAVSSGVMKDIYPELLNADTSFYQGNALNIESLMELEPQAVIITTGDAELRAQIENAGLNAVAFGVGDWGYNIVDTFENWVDLLCDMYPTNENIVGITEHSKDVVSMVESRVSTLSEEEKKDIFFLFQYDDNTIRTSGPNFFGQYWSTTVGANNVAEGTGGGQVEVTMEQVYDWNPDMIFITNFTTAKPDDLYGNTIGDNDWSFVEAVQNEEVHKMPMGSFRTYAVSAEMPVVLLWMAQKTYPELFEDVDIQEELVAFYEMAFQITLTDAQVKQILHLEGES